MYVWDNDEIRFVSWNVLSSSATELAAPDVVDHEADEVCETGKRAEKSAETELRASLDVAASETAAEAETLAEEEDLVDEAEALTEEEVWVADSVLTKVENEDLVEEAEADAVAAAATTAEALLLCVQRRARLWA